MAEVAATSAGASKPKRESEAKRAKGTAKIATHPTYFEMVAHAIRELKERNGSSRQAIMKIVTSEYKDLGDGAKHRVSLALKRGVANGHFKQIKSSFKLTDEGKSAISDKVPKSPKPAKKAIVKKAVVKKPKVKKAPAAKKAKAKKSGRAKTAAVVKKVTKKSVKAKPAVKKAKPASRKTKVSKKSTK